MIDEHVITDVAARLGHAGPDEVAVAELRRAWPGVHFTSCLDDDVGAATPFREAGGFNIYLVAAVGGDCIRFTDELRLATGLVLALVEEDAD